MHLTEKTRPGLGTRTPEYGFWKGSNKVLPYPVGKEPNYAGKTRIIGDGYFRRNKRPGEFAWPLINLKALLRKLNAPPTERANDALVPEIEAGAKPSPQSAEYARA